MLSAPGASDDLREASDRAHPAPELTVILPVRNGAGTIRNQLDALVAQHWDRPWEILVVDNDSDDATPEIVSEYAAADDRVRVVAARDKRGLSHARNVGVEHAAAPAVVFCDDDDLVGEGFVAAMGDALLDHPLVACRMEYGRLNDHAQMADRAQFQSAHLERVAGYEISLGVSGWHRSLWRQLGGNDESITTAGEDFDMAIRASRDAGVSPHFEPDAVYHIARRDGFKETFRQSRRYGASQIMLIGRYGPGDAGRPSPVQSAKLWLALARHADDLLDPERRVSWARRFGTRLGRLEEGVRERAWTVTGPTTSRQDREALGRVAPPNLDPPDPSSTERRYRSARNLGAVTVAGVRHRAHRAAPGPRPSAAYGKVFIVGCGRSGTSWVQDCVGSSSRVITTQESHAYDNIYSTLLAHGHSVRTWARVLHRYDLDQRRQRWVGLYWWVTRAELVAIIGDLLAQPDLSPADAASQAIEAIFDAWHERQGEPGQVMVEKTPGHLMFGPAILEHFPEATMIEVVRDGRDVCVSLEKQALTLSWPPTERADQIRLWTRSIEAGQRLHADPRYADRILRVHYEDLLDDPVGQLDRVFTMAGLPQPPERLEEIAAEQSIAKHGGRADGRHRRKGKAGEWRNELSDEDVALFEDLAGDLSRAIGYDDEGRVRP